MQSNSSNQANLCSVLVLCFFIQLHFLGVGCHGWLVRFRFSRFVIILILLNHGSTDKPGKAGQPCKQTKTTVVKSAVNKAACFLVCPHPDSIMSCQH